MRKILVRMLQVGIAVAALVLLTEIVLLAAGTTVSNLLGTSDCSLAESRKALEVMEAEKAFIGSTPMKLVRSDSHLELWRTIQGDYWIPSKNRNELAAIMFEQEREIYGSVRPGDVVLDCGASFGVYTRKALKQGASKVIAIEPAPDVIECLRRNFAAEIAEGHVAVYPKGVLDRDTSMPMYEQKDHSGSRSVALKGERGKSGWTMELTTIDKLVRELNLPRVDFIKMDIEGAEENAIVGARETIRRFHPRMALCVYHFAEDIRAIPAAVRNIDPSYQVAECQCKAWNRFSIVREVDMFR